MPEPTSALTLKDLIIEVARKLGYADYGVNGDEPIQIPQDAHDLDLCIRTVNKAIRTFIRKAPAGGWRWLRPVMTTTLWNSVALDATNLITSVSYDPATNKTILSTSVDSFYESMEEKEIVLTGIATHLITDFVNASSIKVQGDATSVGAVGVTWSIESDGNYTLPRSFSGEYNGEITYVAGTNQGVSLTWYPENDIRRWREDVVDESGDPWMAAIRIMSSGSPRRRWELMTYPKIDEVMTVEFPFTIGFDDLVELDEVPPSPFSHDDTVKAACLGIAERDEEGGPGPDWEYFIQDCLPDSYRIDGMSAPRRLGYFGNPARNIRSSGEALSFFRNNVYNRPNVSFNP